MFTALPAEWMVKVIEVTEVWFVYDQQSTICVGVCVCNKLDESTAVDLWLTTERQFCSSFSKFQCLVYFDILKHGIWALITNRIWDKVILGSLWNVLVFLTSNEQNKVFFKMWGQHVLCFLISRSSLNVSEGGEKTNRIFPLIWVHFIYQKSSQT